MAHATAALGLGLVIAIGAPPTQDVPLPAGGPLTVAGDVRVRPGRYVRPAQGPDGRGGVLVARGLSGATLDLAGVELLGAEPGTELDRLGGWGLVLVDCRDVTVRGGRIGGYKGCVVAERCKGLVLEDMTFEGWFGQRLLSTTAAENPADWLWPHDNDAGEWLANYGAAISLADCEGAVIRRCRGRKGQNGILLTRSSGTRVYDDDFSFLSGWGLAMYRSSHNVVCRNVFDYCVRGYSHGVYWRGQDSAGILMFERCSDNVIALNSATHGGDGLFLFAGRDSVDGLAYERGETEVGGSDRNLFWRNDFSYAVANSIEATFSRGNAAVGNLARGSHQHGVWGGYSSRMLIADNDFSDTIGGGVTIEHGQDCVIQGNVFRRCATGVELYWDEDPQLVGGPFGQRHDTRSRGHWVVGNDFADNGADLVVDLTRELGVVDNRFAPGLAPPELEEVTLEGAGDDVLAALRGADGRLPTGRVSRSSLRAGEARDFHGAAPDAVHRPEDLPGEQVAFDPGLDDGEGLETIVMGEWGPWDFRGGEPRPAPRLPGGALAGAVWRARWFSWADGPDPREDERGWRELARDPLAEGQVTAWAGPFGGDAERRSAVGGAHFGLLARTELELPAGRYELEVTSDDGVRVRVDGQPVLENWTWHAPTTDRAELALAPGPHTFELEYFQIDGALALTVELRPAER